MQIGSRDLNRILVECDIADEVLLQRRMLAPLADADRHVEPLPPLDRIGSHDLRRVLGVEAGVGLAELRRELLGLLLCGESDAGGAEKGKQQRNRCGAQRNSSSFAHRTISSALVKLPASTAGPAPA